MDGLGTAHDLGNVLVMLRFTKGDLAVPFLVSLVCCHGDDVKLDYKLPEELRSMYSDPTLNIVTLKKLHTSSSSCVCLSVCARVHVCVCLLVHEHVPFNSDSEI